MQSLFEILKAKVAEWRERDYAHAEYPAIAEILEWSVLTRHSRVRKRYGDILS